MQFILFISVTSQYCKQVTNFIYDNSPFFSFIKVIRLDDLEKRQKAINSIFNIEEVPTLVTVTDDGNYNMYIGCNKIFLVLQNILNNYHTRQQTVNNQNNTLLTNGNNLYKSSVKRKDPNQPHVKHQPPPPHVNPSLPQEEEEEEEEDIDQIISRQLEEQNVASNLVSTKKTSRNLSIENDEEEDSEGSEEEQVIKKPKRVSKKIPKKHVKKHRVKQPVSDEEENDQDEENIEQENENPMESGNNFFAPSFSKNNVSLSNVGIKTGVTPNLSSSFSSQPEKRNGISSNVINMAKEMEKQRNSYIGLTQN